MTDKPVRPRQILMSGWLVLVGSVFVVLMAYQQVAGLGTLESQEAAADLISRPPGDGLGLSANDVQGILRVLGLLAGAGGATTAILGLMLLRRRAPADRLALTLLAPVLFVAGITVAGLSAVIVVLAIAFLWSTPARAWFAGLDPAPAQPRGTRTAPGSAPPPREDPWSASAIASAQARSRVGERVHPPSGPGDAVATAVRRNDAPQTSGRPGVVLAACIVTWVCCGAALLLVSATVLVFAVSPGPLLEQLREQNGELSDQGLTDHGVKVAVFVGAGVLVPWCLAAIVFAVLVMRRVRWAAIALLVTAGLAALVSGVLLIGSGLTVLPLAACLTTTWLLGRPESRSWLAPRDTMIR